MEANLASQPRPIPWNFRGTHTHLYGIQVDAKWKRARLCLEKPRNQSIAVGALTRSHIRARLTKLQMLDISCGLSFLHTRGIVHGALRGVRSSRFLHRPLAVVI